MKKIVFISALLIICLGLIACGESKKYDNEIKIAVNALKQRWTDIYKESSGKNIATDGYFEIKNTRVITVKEGAFNILGYDNIKCIVEFILSTDYLGFSPYYSILDYESTVVVFNDGTAKIFPQNTIRTYLAVAFPRDLSAVIQSIDDLGGGYNVILKLPE